jgi:hypothetical protein
MRLLIAAAAALMLRGCAPSPVGAGDIWRAQQHFECDRACEWARTLMQPDNPMTSCCGEADRYEADDFAVEGGEVIAIITDGHGVIPDGTRVRVPDGKLKWDAGNPTGHGQIFMNGANNVYCYVPPGGV